MGYISHSKLPEKKLKDYKLLKGPQFLIMTPQDQKRQKHQQILHQEGGIQI